MFYVLIEWDGKGSYEKIIRSNDKKTILSEREYILTARKAKQKYNPNYFYKSDVPCSEIKIYKSEYSYKKGNPPIRVLLYY